jgi:mono/diheme cytochrome c family protein
MNSNIDGAAAQPRFLVRQWQRLMAVPLGRLLRWLLWVVLVLLILAVGAFTLYVLLPASTIPAYEPIDEYVYADQGWGTQMDAPQRQLWYYTPQGTSLPQGALTTAMRYDWFVHLEMPFGTARFADPEHMRRYRFLVDPESTPANPDQLPVGFTRHFSPAIGEYVLDITCSACHTGELHYPRADGRRVALRIDGGQAMHAFTDMQRGSFAPTLAASLIATYFNPPKFNRFARKVIGARYPAGKSALKEALWSTIKALLETGQNNPLRHLYPVREGFGRTDALGRIANTAFGDHLVPGNYQVADAPVSYPYLWNIWKFDWVQYNGSVSQPLARNVGEAMGVGAVLRLTDTYGNPLPKDQRLDSSVMVPNLVRIEHALQHLKPPAWPEDLFGAVDPAKVEQGRELFESHCRHCHGPHVASAAQQQAEAPGKPGPWAQWRIEVIDVDHIGTDATAARAFIDRRYDLTAAGLDRDEIAGLLRPLLVRQLARDARYRLREVIDGRRALGMDVTLLEALLEAYPDPDSQPQPFLPRDSFAAIELALASPAPTQAPPLPWECDLDCHTDWLAWDVTGAEADIERQLARLEPASLTEGEGLNLLGLLIKNRYYRENGIDYTRQQCIEGFGTLDLPQQIAGYKPRPLAGVWATPPFLHNGSVPSLYEMLLPPDRRSKRFFVGRRDYDPLHVGYVTEPDEDGTDDGFWLDTTVKGNSNAGHGFSADAQTWANHRADPRANPLPPGVIGPAFSDEQRWALVEYLKVHRDPETPADFQSPDCGLPGVAP